MADYASTGKPKLLDQVRDAIRAKHYSIRTEEAYVHWIKRYILFHNKRHPSAMREREVSEFLNHLAIRQKVSSSTHNQALSALVFLYGQVLGLQLGTIEKLERHRRFVTRYVDRARLAQPRSTRSARSFFTCSHITAFFVGSRSRKAG